MTPTEQDKELHSKSYKLAQEYLSTNNLECFVDLIQNNLTLDEAMQLITQYGLEQEKAGIENYRSDIVQLPHHQATINADERIAELTKLEAEL